MLMHGRRTWWYSFLLAFASEDALSGFEKLINCKPNILRDLPQQNGRDVSSFMKWNSRSSSIRMAILFV